MQRFLPIGQARIQVLGSVMHDPAGAERVAALLMQLQPEAVVVDRSVAEWTGPPDALQQVVLQTVPGLKPGALWNAVDGACRRLGLSVALLHRDIPPPPGPGIQTLRRLLDKEGFEATGDARRDVARLHEHYVARCGPLWQWIEGRRDASAARLRAAFETKPRRAVAVVPFPDADAVCDRVQEMGK